MANIENKITKAKDLLHKIPTSEHYRIIEIIRNLMNDNKFYDNQDFWQSFNQASQGKVDRAVLYSDISDKSKNVLVILKYDNAVVNYHYHVGEEIILVLDGYQETFNHKKYEIIQPELFHKIKNDHLRYDFDDGIIVNKIGTGHSVRSDYCIALIFYQTLPRF
jgi:hypothetical protein